LPVYHLTLTREEEASAGVAEVKPHPPELDDESSPPRPATDTSREVAKLCLIVLIVASAFAMICFYGWWVSIR
jgi:hypothetical protein